MLSTGSLAAFTASAPQAQPLRAVPDFAATPGVRRANAQTAAPAGAAASPLQTPAQGGGAPPASSLPRGSLLDLSV